MFLLRLVLAVSLAISCVASGQPSYSEYPVESNYLSQPSSSQYSSNSMYVSQPISTSYSGVSGFTGQASYSSVADEGLTPASGYYGQRNMQVLQTGSNEVTARIPNLLQDSGQVRSDGTYSSYPNVGSSGSTNAQAFLGFDISSIPKDADIRSVSLQFEGWDMVGTPFSKMGCLNIFPVTYRLLGSQSYFSLAITPPCLKVCSSSQMNSPLVSSDLTRALQSSLGQEKFQLRLQFEGEAEIPESSAISRVYTIGESASSSDDYLSSGIVRRYVSSGDSGDSYISISSSYDPQIMQDMGFDQAFLQSDRYGKEGVNSGYIFHTPGFNLTELGITPEILNKAANLGQVRIASGYNPAHLIETVNTFNGTWRKDATSTPSCPYGYCPDSNNDGVCDSSDVIGVSHTGWLSRDPEADSLQSSYIDYGRDMLSESSMTSQCCPDFNSDGYCDLPDTHFTLDMIKIGVAWLIIAYRLPPPPCDQASCQAQSKPTGQPYVRGSRMYQAYSNCNCIEGTCQCNNIEKDIGPAPCDQASCQAQSRPTGQPYARSGRMYQAFSDCSCTGGTCQCTGVEKDMGPASCDQASCTAQSKPIGQPYARDGRMYQAFSDCSCAEDSCRCQDVEKDVGDAESLLPTPITTISGVGNGSYKPPDPNYLVKTSDWGEVPSNQLIVVLSDGASLSDLQALADSLGGRVVGYLDFINLYQIETTGKTEADLRRAISIAKTNAKIDLAFPNQKVYRDRSPLDDPVYAQGKGKSQEIAGVQQAWDLIRGSGLSLSEVNIGVIDDGLYRGYGEFSGVVKIDTRLPDSELKKPSAEYPITGSHGTGIMNIIAADPDNGGLVGIASEPLRSNLSVTMANIYTSSLFSSTGDSWYLAAMLALSMEIGTGSNILSCSGGNSETTLDGVEASRKFFSFWAGNDTRVLFICSAGDDGEAINGSRRFPNGYNLSNVITVGSIRNDGSICPKSNRASSNFEVTLAAPGDQIVQGKDDKGNIWYEDGQTSMAVPMVTAAAALIRSLDENLTAAEIKAVLMENARKNVVIGNSQFSAPSELGGRILAIDLAVEKVIAARKNETAK